MPELRLSIMIAKDLNSLRFLEVHLVLLCFVLQETHFD